MRRLAILLALIVMASGAGTEAQSAGVTPVLSLDDVETLLRQQNRSLQQARLAIDRAREHASAVRTHKFPSMDVKVASGSLVAPLDFRFAAGVFGTSTVLGPIPGQETVIRTGPRLNTILFASVTQPLTQLPRLNAAQLASQLAVDVATEEANGREGEIVAAARKLYYGIVQAESGARAAGESITLSQELVRVLERSVEQRVALEADLLDARAGLREQELQITLARNAAAAGREQLNALLARDLDVPFAVEPLQPATPVDEDVAAAEARALAARPEIRARHLDIRRTEVILRATRRPGVPDLSATFQYAGFYNFELLPRHGALAGVLLVWEPWDWGRARGERAERQLQRAQAEAAAAEAEAQVRVQVRASLRALREAFARLTVSEAAQASARERLRIVTERVRQASALDRELLTAQARLATADQARSQALAGYWSARAEYDRARGQR